MVRAYIQKAVSAALEWLGRLLVFNRFPPTVGDYARDIPYDCRDRRKQSLDIAVPEGTGPFPVLVYIHGGGFHFMDKKSYTRVAKSFAHGGYIVFNINYRLAPKTVFPEQLQDVAKAIRWAYDNAESYGGDPDRVFLAGDSAGAYFSSMYAAAIRDAELAAAVGITEPIPPEKLKGLLLFYGGYDMDTILHTGFASIEFMCRGFLGVDGHAYRERAQIASPIRHIDPGYPPSFIFSGERDKLHPQSVDFERALTAAGVEHRTLFFDGKRDPEAFHGFISAYFLRPARIAMKAALEFLDGLK